MPHDLAIVSEDDIRAVTHGIVAAVAAVDRVVAIGPVQHVVAANQIVLAGVAIDEVIPLLAEDEVVASAAVDFIIPAAIGRGDIDGLEALKGRESRTPEAGVAEQDVAAIVAEDGVVPCTAENDVIARAGMDRVVSTERRIGAANLIDGGGIAIVDHGIDETIVTEQHVCSIIAIKRVVAEAAEDDVTLAATVNLVIAAFAGPHRLDTRDICGAEKPRSAGHLGNHTRVAKEDIHPRIAVEFVIARRHPVAIRREAGVVHGHGQHARREVHVEPRIAVDVTLPAPPWISSLPEPPAN